MPEENGNLDALVSRLRKEASDLRGYTYATLMDAAADTISALIIQRDHARTKALNDAAHLVENTNYYEPNATTARRIREYDGDEGMRGRR